MYVDGYDTHCTRLPAPASPTVIDAAGTENEWSQIWADLGYKHGAWGTWREKLTRVVFHPRVWAEDEHIISAVFEL